jgi:HAD superfamily hydrolase (TIGR01549 family)
MIRSVSLDLGGTLLTEIEPRPAIYAAEARRVGVAVSDGRMAELMRAAHRRLPEVLTVPDGDPRGPEGNSIGPKGNSIGPKGNSIGPKGNSIGWYRYSDPWFERFIAQIFQVELGVANGTLTLVTERLFARFQSAETFRQYPGIDPLLTGLRRLGLRVGVLSNWSARLPQVLEAVGLGEAFDFVVCSAIDRVEKPDRRAFELAAARAGCAPHECLHAGDRLDLDGAARDANCNFVLVAHPDAGHRELPPGVDAVDGLAGLLRFVEERVA